MSAAGLVAVAAPAGAQPVESGTLVFSGDPGDWITGGGEYSFDTADGDQFTVSSGANARTGRR